MVSACAKSAPPPQGGTPWADCEHYNTLTAVRQFDSAGNFPANRLKCKKRGLTQSVLLSSAPVQNATTRRMIASAAAATLAVEISSVRTAALRLFLGRGAGMDSSGSSGSP